MKDSHTKRDNIPVTFDRLRMLERRIEELEKKLSREKELFLDEDLKARGLK